MALYSPRAGGAARSWTTHSATRFRAESAAALDVVRGAGAVVPATGVALGDEREEPETRERRLAMLIADSAAGLRVGRLRRL